MVVAVERFSAVSAVVHGPYRVAVHRRARTRRLVVLLVPGLLAVLAGCGHATPSARTSAASSAPVTAAEVATASASAAPTVAVAPPVNSVTPGGYWWGVDSSGPVGDAGLAAVKGWYQGATPTVWGRYLVGHYALQPGEVEWAAAHDIYLDLLIPDSNCSHCNGGRDICGNDRSAQQAMDDAQQTLAAAAAHGIKAGALLLKDLEQVGSCRGEPTGVYVNTWYEVVKTSQYRVGLYGNTTEQTWDFPTAYCAALTLDPQIGADVVIDGNEPEPQIGAPSGTSGPATAPDFAPFTPACAPAGSTKIWQYGESLDAGNYVDVDQVAPGMAGLLAPDGSIAGGDTPVAGGP